MVRIGGEDERRNREEKSVVPAGGYVSFPVNVLSSVTSRVLNDALPFPHREVMCLLLEYKSTTLSFRSCGTPTDLAVYFLSVHAPGCRLSKFTERLVPNDMDVGAHGAGDERI